MHEKDICIIIKCECEFYQDWMTFASWYSIYKNISDAQVLINLRRNKNLFNWIDKLGVNFYKNKQQIKRSVVKVISPSVIAVRNFIDKLEISSTKSDINSTFVDYKFGCGKFSLDQWVTKKKAPFRSARSVFFDKDMTVNEYAVLGMLEDCLNAYIAVGGSA